MKLSCGGGKLCKKKNTKYGIKLLAFFMSCGCHGWNLVTGDAASSYTKDYFSGVLCYFSVHSVGGMC
jgi:hypothetical protein